MSGREVIGNVFVDCIYDKNKGKCFVGNDLKSLLLEFTLNALLDQPEDLLPYTKKYFEDLEAPKATISYDVIHPDASNPNLMDDFNPAMFTRERAKVIYSEAYNPEKDDDDDDDNIVFYPKTRIQTFKLNQACKKCILFKNLDNENMDKVINAMFQKDVNADDYIIEQGEDGDNFYIIENGKYNVFIDNNFVFTYEDEGSFGELALMYNMPRAATVQAVTSGTLWGLDRVTFRKIVLKGVYKRRKMYEDFLENVPMLTTMTPYERMNVADALMPKTYKEGDIIIAEGEEADGMYFVEEGEVVITVKEESSKDIRVKLLKKGDYFGELALVTKRPRAATATAFTETVKCAFLDVSAFERVLGPCMELLERNIEAYSTLFTSDVTKT